MKKIALFLTLFGALAACNTIEGIGEDIAGGARTVNRAIN